MNAKKKRKRKDDTQFHTAITCTMISTQSLITRATRRGHKQAAPKLISIMSIQKCETTSPMQPWNSEPHSLLDAIQQKRENAAQFYPDSLLPQEGINIDTKRACKRKHCVREGILGTTKKWQPANSQKDRKLLKRNRGRFKNELDEQCFCAYNAAHVHIPLNS